MNGKALMVPITVALLLVALWGLDFSPKITPIITPIISYNY